MENNLEITSKGTGKLLYRRNPGDLLLLLHSSLNVTFTMLSIVNFQWGRLPLLCLIRLGSVITSPFFAPFQATWLFFSKIVLSASKMSAPRHQPWKVTLILFCTALDDWGQPHQTAVWLFVLPFSCVIGFMSFFSLSLPYGLISLPSWQS